MASQYIIYLLKFGVVITHTKKLVVSVVCCTCVHGEGQVYMRYDDGHGLARATRQIHPSRSPRHPTKSPANHPHARILLTATSPASPIQQLWISGSSSSAGIRPERWGKGEERESPVGLKPSRIISFAASQSTP